MSLKPVAAALATALGSSIAFADDCVGDVAKQAIGKLKPGGVVLLENTRFHAEEEKNDPAFAKRMASLGDIFVNDAFRSEEHTSELQSLMRISYAVFCLKKKIIITPTKVRPAL